MFLSINFLHDRYVASFRIETAGRILAIDQERAFRGHPYVAERQKMGEKDQLDKAVTDFIWNIVEIHSQLEEIHKGWAEMMGISEPQWLIMMAIDEIDEGRGVSGIAVANKLRIHPAFVTNQTKKLEENGLLSRVTSPDDARYLQISLTEKARAEIASLSNKRQALNLTMFAGLDEASLEYLNKRLASIAKNSRLASQKLSIGVL
ncbi:MarR family winged helix-turn-helix transcriptional regulator [Bradyrhizobium sp. 23AC]